MMAKRTRKTKEVQKFGGEEHLGKHKLDLGGSFVDKAVDYDISSLEVQSDTKLEHDEGYGGAAIIRCFEFGMNPEAFAQYQPTKQELFNSHYKGIEVALWRDGMKVIDEVNPRVVIEPEKMKYRIFVGAKPARGNILTEQPRTLRQLVHDDNTNG